MVTSATSPASTMATNSVNFFDVSFFWIWAKCQARKMTTRSDIHNMTVLNVAFTIFGPPALPTLSLYAPRAAGAGQGDGADVGQSPVALGVVQAVPDQEPVLRRLPEGEGRPLGVDVDLALPRLVDQRADLEAAGLALPDVFQEEVQGDPGVDDVVEDQDVAPLVGHGGGVDDLGAGRPPLLLPLRADPHEVDREGGGDLADQVGHEDEAAFHETDHGELAVRVGLPDLGAELAQPSGDLLFGEEDLGLVHRLPTLSVIDPPPYPSPRRGREPLFRVRLRSHCSLAGRGAGRASGRPALPPEVAP